MTIPELICAILLIIVTVILIINTLKKVIKKERFTARDKALPVIVFGAAFLFVISLAYRYSDEIELAEFVQILLMFGLVTVTSVYAWSASKQSGASVKMAKEMKQGRLESVRPILAIETQDFSLRIVENHTIQLNTVRIKNIGVGPALNVVCSLNYPGHGFDPREWPVLAKDEPKEFTFATRFARGGNRLARCEAAIVLEYTDVFHNPYWTKVSFTADEQNQKVTERGSLELDEGKLEG